MLLILFRPRKLSTWWKTLGYLSIAFLALCQSSMDASQFQRAANKIDTAPPMFNASSSFLRSKRETRSVLFDDDPVMTSIAIVHPKLGSSIKEVSSSSGGGGVDERTGSARAGRARRDIFHLYNMMSCTTHCDPLSYKGYGCYCGFLGSGHAVDFIDSCCRKHDDCYGNTPCRHQSLIYFVPYKWKCNGGHPYCVVPHGATKASDHCAHHLCECDRQFAECIRRFPCPAKKTTCPSNPFRSLG